MDSTLVGIRRSEGGALDRSVACWGELDEPRTGNAGLHDFHEMLFIALCSVLCGGQGTVDMALFAKSKERYLRGVLTLANGAPSQDTFSRLFRQIDPEAFQAAFQRLIIGFSEQCRSLASGAAPVGVVATDGKVLRRSRETAAGMTAEPAYRLLSTALSHDRLNEVARSHWRIGNQLRWRLDTGVRRHHERKRGPRPPGTRTREPGRPAPHGPERHPGRTQHVSLHGKLRRAGWDRAYLTKLLKLFEMR